MTGGQADTAAFRTGSPAAIALSPILWSRYSPADLARIAAAAPGERLVRVAADGTADGRLHDVEVLLCGSGLDGYGLDRLLARSPRMTSVGVKRVLTPVTLARGIVVTNGRGVFSRSGVVA